jgi:hypothetical protein
MQGRKLDELDNLLSDYSYRADAVSMDQDSLLRIKNEFQQRFEKNYVSFADIENYLGVKILLLHETSGKKEFNLYTELKERD